MDLNESAHPHLPQINYEPYLFLSSPKKLLVSSQLHVATVAAVQHTTMRQEDTTPHVIFLLAYY
uniref:Uncharacterized protein n=1 Tax=Oryza brachyantha TaxID=4533 RepID=J3N734_ORYBR